MILSEINGDRPVRRINMSVIRRKYTANLERLFHVIDSYGFKVRIVGGAVRDVLLGREPRDIDLITDALPDAVMYILGKHDIKYLTRGIPHGTVKVKFAGDEEYEITSLGYEVDDECCPKKIVIHSGESWRGDANRRDFTVDTLSVTLDGQLYDYLGGFGDLRSQTVKFIGSPAERIQNDPVLILRFFKLLSMFRNPQYDKGLLPLLKEKMKLVKKVKPKRTKRELETISKNPNGEKVRKLMSDLGFDDIYGQIKECVLICESIQDLVPALIAQLPDGRKHVLVGERGDNHGIVYEKHMDEIDKTGAEIVGSGFYNAVTKQYLTREQAHSLVLKSKRPAKLQSAQLAHAQSHGVGRQDRTPGLDNRNNR